MKIAVLTQPIDTNYGALMQAYAVQKTLRDMGHVVCTLRIDRKPESPSFIKMLVSFGRSFVSFLLGRCSWKRINWPYNHNIENNLALRYSTIPFMEKIMKLSPLINQESQLRSFCEKQGFEAYVVGSDQVWRPRYSANIGWFFLDFIDRDKDKVKRMSFSASFGTSEWEFSDDETSKCAALAKKFDAISVRELTGVVLCKNYLGVDAIQTIDPTMLLSPADYCKILNLDYNNTESVSGKLFTYILDTTYEKERLIKQVAIDLSLPVYSMTAKYKLPGPYATIETALENAPKPVAQWLRGFQDAEFVVTDSFHGTVFSILHHKPFIVVGNKTRGLARLETLLKTYGLENRFVERYSIEILTQPICWERVDEILYSKRKELRSFVHEALKK